MSKSKTKDASGVSSFLEYKFALILVAVVGLVGTIYILSSINQDSETEHNIIVIPKESKNLESNVLIISGPMFENEELTFSINDFNPALNYSINFGDNDIRLVTRSNFSHRFRKAGIYQIELKIEYQKDVFLLDKQSLNIKTGRNTLTAL